MKKKYSYTGKKFNKLTVLDYFNKNKDIYYNCICDCGNKTQVRWDCFERKNPTQSCGCIRKLTCKKNQMISSEKRWLGGNEGAKRILLSYYKSNAARREHIFELTNEQFYDLTSKNCYYCGIKPSTEQKLYRSKVDKIFESYFYNGIDRINSDLGYTIDNCLTACVDCNRAKQDLTTEQFFNMISLIYNKHIRFKLQITPEQRAENAYQDTLRMQELNRKIKELGI